MLPLKFLRNRFTRSAWRRQRCCIINARLLRNGR